MMIHFTLFVIFNYPLSDFDLQQSLCSFLHTASVSYSEHICQAPKIEKKEKKNS